MSNIPSQQRQWQAPDQIQIVREPGWGYKFFCKEHVEKRLAEGWEVVEKKVMLRNETGPLERAQQYRGLILMRMPQHMVDQRNEHYHNKHKRRLRAVAQGARIAGNAARAATRNEDNESGDLAGPIGKGLTLKQGVVTEDGLVHTNNETIKIETDPEAAAALAGDTEDLKTVRKAQQEEDHRTGHQQKGGRK